jgi:hypothetical protein
VDPDEDEVGQPEASNRDDPSRLSKLLKFMINIQLALIVFLAILWLYDQPWDIFFSLHFR